MKKFILTVNFIPSLTFGMENKNENEICKKINDLKIINKDLKLSINYLKNLDNSKFPNYKFLNEIKYKYKDNKSFESIIKKFDDICKSKSIFSRKDFMEISNSKEFKIKEIISEDINYISGIFNNKFLYDFENIFNLKEQCVIFKTIRNILWNYIEIEDRFKYIFNDEDNDRYFLICNFNDKDKTHIGTIKRVLEKNNIKMDNNLLEYTKCNDININKNDTNCGKTSFLKNYIIVYLKNNCNILNNSLADFIDNNSFMNYEIKDIICKDLSKNNEIYKFYNLSFIVSHEFFHSLDLSSPVIELGNKYFSSINDKNEIIKNENFFYLICQNIENNNKDYIMIDFLRDIVNKMEGNDILFNDFTNFITETKLLENKDYNNCFHTLYSYNNNEELQELFHEYGNWCYTLDINKKMLFYCLFFDKYGVKNYENDNFKTSLDECLKNFKETQNIIDKKKNNKKTTEENELDTYFKKRSEIYLKCYDLLSKYYNTFSKYFDKKEIDDLLNNINSKITLEKTSNFDFKSKLVDSFMVNKFINESIDNILEKKNELSNYKQNLNINEFLADTFAISMLSPTFITGTFSVLHIYNYFLGYSNLLYLKKKNENKNENENESKNIFNDTISFYFKKKYIANMNKNIIDKKDENQNNVEDKNKIIIKEKTENKTKDKIENENKIIDNIENKDEIKEKNKIITKKESINDNKKNNEKCIIM